MDKLVESLFSQIQFIVLGAFSLALAAYFLALYHPWRSQIVSYLQDLERLWLSGIAVPAAVLHWIRISTLIGLLYYLGVIITTSSYWLVEPVRFAVLDCIFDNSRSMSTYYCPSHGKKAADVGYFRELYLPITAHIPGLEDLSILKPPGVDANDEYIKSETRVQNHAPLKINSTLDNELMFARILRGSAEICLLATFIGIVKLVFVLSTSRSWSIGEGDAFKDIVDFDEKRLISVVAKRTKIDEDVLSTLIETDPEEWKRRVSLDDRRNTAWKFVIFPQIVLLILFILTYCLTMTSYVTTEFEYSSLVKHASPIAPS